MKGRATIVLLAGCTGVGKTELSLELAERIGAEIVNVDSMQVYRYMDVGTAKPTAVERARVPHHLLDVADPDEDFDAGRYLALADPAIEDLHGKGKVALLVGGTGLYMKALLHGVCPAPPGDAEVRERLRIELEQRGSAALHGELTRVDPVTAGRLHPNDRQRILRALEVYRCTGRPLSTGQESHGFRPQRYRAVKVFLHREREDLYDRINRRTGRMLELGFLEEVRGLLERGYSPQLKSMQALGYRHLAGHLLGLLSLEEALHELRRDTRRYAKRQLTWFRADPEFKWFHPEQREEVLRYVRTRLEG